MPFNIYCDQLGDRVNEKGHARNHKSEEYPFRDWVMKRKAALQANKSKVGETSSNN